MRTSLDNFLQADEGTSTVEYVTVTLGAVFFAIVLIGVIKDGSVADSLKALLERAFTAS